MKVWIAAALLTYAAAKGDGPPDPGPNQEQTAIIHLAEAQRDALVAKVCRYRSLEWLDVVSPVIAQAAYNIAAASPKQVGGEPYKGAAIRFAYGALQQSAQDAETEFARHGADACQALTASGALEYLDAVYTNAKKLPAK